MQQIFFRFFAIMLVCMAAVSASAQTQSEELDGLADNMKRVMRFNLWRPQEKVYLHLDNTGYFKGETIWFKGYVVRADTGAPTDLSSVLYVELLNPSGDVVERRKLHIDNGVAHGDIKVDSIVITGFYEIRAFTRYMTNWGTNACFSRVIPIFKEPKYEGDYSNPLIDKFAYNRRLNNERIASIDARNENIVEVGADGSEAKKADNRQRRVRFYPEGGDMIAGQPSKVAFTLVDADGMPQSELCTVTDRQGNTLAQCRTDANGFGCFTVKAAASGLSLQAGDKRKQELPEPKTEGLALQVDMLGNDVLTMDIHTTQELHDHLIGYVIMHNGKIVRGDTLTAAAHVTKQLPRSIMPAGVSQITFCTSEGRILAERMVFVCPPLDDTRRITVASPTALLKPCSKVKFDITAQPNSSLSFSAIDADGLVNGSNGNMNTWMLLGSELRGYIAHPEYYFESDDREHRQAADLLMLIQGWRRYDWNLMTGQSTFMKFQPIEDKLYLFGRLRQKTKKGTVDNVWIETTMFNNEGQVIEGTTKTDSIGNYVYEVPDIDGEWRMLINTGKEGKDGYWEDTNFYTAIDRNFSPAGKYVSPVEAAATPIDTTHTFRWVFSEEDERWVSNLDRTRVLKNVTVTAKKRFWDRTNWGNESNPQKHSVLYYNCDEHSDRIADEGEAMPTLYEWLKRANSFFDGTDTPEDGYTISVDSNLIGTAGTQYNLTLEGKSQDDDGNPFLFYRGGLAYNNRPIVWILDNEFYQITNMPTMSKIDVQFRDTEGRVPINIFPEFLDEAKSVYVSEDMSLLHNHFMSPQIDSRQPVVVCVYSHRQFLYKKKGLRRTHFQGYNVPSTFEMEDYSDLPPMEDFRRTLYWDPDVTTDSNGKAIVEFWNNSTAKEIKVSCEGMTPDGTPQVY